MSNFYKPAVCGRRHNSYEQPPIPQKDVVAYRYPLIKTSGNPVTEDAYKQFTLIASSMYFWHAPGLDFYGGREGVSYFRPRWDHVAPEVFGGGDDQSAYGGLAAWYLSKPDSFQSPNNPWNLPFWHDNAGQPHLFRVCPSERVRRDGKFVSPGGGEETWWIRWGIMYWVQETPSEDPRGTYILNDKYVGWVNGVNSFPPYTSGFQTYYDKIITEHWGKPIPPSTDPPEQVWFPPIWTDTPDTPATIECRDFSYVIRYYRGEHNYEVPTGNVPAWQFKAPGVDITLDNNSGGLTLPGHTFDGWQYYNFGGWNNYAGGSTYTEDADIWFEPKWI